VPPSNRATISRLPEASNPKLDWLHSVIAKAVLFLALTAVWKLSYATNDGLLPIAGEKSGLALPEAVPVPLTMRNWKRKKVKKSKAPEV
jgi:hypothetical protein